MSTDDRIPLSEAALRMKQTYHQVRTMVLANKLDGGRDHFGWWVDDRAVAQWVENNRQRRKEDVS